jgi:hypothetical protein
MVKMARERGAQWCHNEENKFINHSRKGGREIEERVNNYDNNRQ